MLHKYQIKLCILIACALIVLFNACSVFAATVTVEPNTTRSIHGISDLDRLKYINLSSSGSWYESKVGTRYDYYVNDLEMTFGRNLSIVKGEVDWGSSIHEDTSAPGTVDIPRMISELNPTNNGASATFINDFSPNLNVASHEHAVNVYPDFMDKYTVAGVEADRWLPSNTVAAADLAVNLLKYGFTDLMRPAFYEIRNEPDWRYWSDQKYIDLHTDIHSKAKQENLSTEIGGPCYSVGYFYKNNYQYLSTITDFIDNTSCGLDFYSFHTYDFMHWEGPTASGDFVGRVTSSLPLDGVLDAIVNYTNNNYSKEVGFVFSEQGGYVSDGTGDTVAEDLANHYFPLSTFLGTAWEWEMQKRSIINYIMVNSAISNTMTYMNHPHTVKKAVPFILDESAAWDPTYYASLLVSENFEHPVNNYSESKLIHFYEFFKDVRGRRIKSFVDDPDLQHHAFVDQDKVVLIFNNVSMSTTALNFQINSSDTVDSITLRRLGRNADFTPYLTEQVIADLSNIQIAGLESAVIIIDYANTITQTSEVDEVPYYGDIVSSEILGSSTTTFTVNIPEYDLADYAILRISVGRPAGTDQDIDVVLNGQTLSIPVEDAADRLENDTEYGSLKSIKIDASLLQAVNTVQVSFPDAQGGGVGSVVIRAALDQGSQGIPVTNMAFIEQGGEVCFEAENYDGLEARSDSPNIWTEDTTASGAVGSYMWTVDGQFLPQYPDYTYGTRLLYDINFTTLGDYTVYVRRQCRLELCLGGP